MYTNGLIQLQAEEDLKEFTYSCYPNMKQDGKKKLHRQTYKVAFPEEFSNPKNIVKLGDLSKVLR